MLGQVSSLSQIESVSLRACVVYLGVSEEMPGTEAKDFTFVSLCHDWQGHLPQSPHQGKVYKSEAQLNQSSTHTR